MPRTLAWLVAVSLFSAFAMALAWSLRARTDAGRDLPEYSVYSQERDGLGPLAHLLQQLGWEPVAITRPMLDSRQHGLLIVVSAAGPEGRQGDWSEVEVNGLMHWVAEGNCVPLRPDVLLLANC